MTTPALSSFGTQPASEFELREAARLLTAVKMRKVSVYSPYPKQREFHRLGATKRERMLMAANQVGKTLCAGFEVSAHATGIYPDDWEGRRYSSANNWWVANTNNETTRDGPQTILIRFFATFADGCSAGACSRRFAWTPANGRRSAPRMRRKKCAT